MHQRLRQGRQGPGAPDSGKVDDGAPLARCQLLECRLVLVIRLQLHHLAAGSCNLGQEGKERAKPLPTAAACMDVAASGPQQTLRHLSGSSADLGCIMCNQ